MMSCRLLLSFLLLCTIALASCTKQESMASISIEVDIAESDRFELLSLPVNYIRTFDAGGSNGSIGSLEVSQTKSLSLPGNIDGDLTIFEGPVFPRTLEGIDPSFGSALVRDIRTGEEIELPVCAPPMIPLEAAAEIVPGSRFRIVLPVDLEALHEVEAITYIDLRAVTAQIQEW
ncbi:hypothetical protein FUA23_04410 [Neolewinella aurantiaca]|uniref:Uncharacterized protein n=1 Tax=Neolewinella aurantiaca TaxID=2602767 RepID=A0A5C7FZH5_9BACT|nr:hypothetical protein [Neolewinella aurantiaca]TXF90688.1 hypothetical protein FUA23_04410 [Neolewinella aurantiaca]